MALEAGIIGFKTAEIYDPEQITSNGNGFYTCFETSSLRHAMVIAYVINHPELADIIIDQKACDDWYEQKHSNKFDK